jgi:heme-degrading monooxygenase HmoA
MFVRIWQFRTAPEHAAEFRRVYGGDGDWAQLFRRAVGYRSTELLESTTDPHTFVTIDRWDSEEAWKTFLERWRERYDALDARCAALTLGETELGTFGRPRSSGT